MKGARMGATPPSTRSHSSQHPAQPTKCSKKSPLLKSKRPLTTIPQRKAQLLNRFDSSPYNSLPISSLRPTTLNSPSHRSPATLLSSYTPSSFTITALNFSPLSTPHISRRFMARRPRVSDSIPDHYTITQDAGSDLENSLSSTVTQKKGSPTLGVSRKRATTLTDEVSIPSDPTASAKRDSRKTAKGDKAGTTELEVSPQKNRRKSAQAKILMNFQYLHADPVDLSHLPTATQNFIRASKFLRYIGLRESEIMQLAQKVPKLFDLDPETDLQPKATFLLNMGWSRERVAHLCVRQPLFFLQNIHNIAFKFQYLLHLGFKLYEFPFLLLAPWSTMSTRDIEARVRWLREFNMSESEIRDSLRVSTRIFTFPVHQLELGVAVLARAGFPPPLITQIIRRAPNAIQSSTLRFRLLARAFEQLLGVSEDQFYSSFIGRWPHLSYVSPNNTYRLFSFLHALGFDQSTITGFLRNQGTCLSIDIYEAAKRLDFLGKELFLPLALPYDRRDYQLVSAQILGHVKPLHASIANALNIIGIRSNRLSISPLLNERPSKQEVVETGELYRLRLIKLMENVQSGRFSKPILHGDHEEPLTAGSLSPLQLFASQIKILRISEIDDSRLRAYPLVDPELRNESMETIERLCFDLTQRSLKNDRQYLLQKVKQIGSLDYETLLQTDYLTTANVEDVAHTILEEEFVSMQHNTPPINLIPSHEDKDSIVSTYTTDGDNIIAVLNNRARVPLKLSLSTIGYKELFVNLNTVLKHTSPSYDKATPFPHFFTLFTRKGPFRAHIPSKLLSDFIQTHIPENIENYLQYETSKFLFQDPTSSSQLSDPTDLSSVSVADLSNSVLPTHLMGLKRNGRTPTSAITDDGHLINIPSDHRLGYLQQHLKVIPNYHYSSLPVKVKRTNSSSQNLGVTRPSPFKGSHPVDQSLAPQFYALDPDPDTLPTIFPKHAHHLRNIHRVSTRQRILLQRMKQRRRDLGEDMSSDEEEEAQFMNSIHNFLTRATQHHSGRIIHDRDDTGTPSPRKKGLKRRSITITETELLGVSDDDNDNDTLSEFPSEEPSADASSYESETDDSSPTDSDFSYSEGWDESSASTSTISNRLLKRQAKSIILNNADLWLDPPLSAQGHIFNSTPVTLTNADFESLSNYVIHVEQTLPHLSTEPVDDVSNPADLNQYHKSASLEDYPSPFPPHQKHISTLSPFYPGLTPTLPPPGKPRTYVVSRAHDQAINRQYPTYNVMLDYVDSNVDLFNPLHTSYINAALPEDIGQLNLRPLPFRDIHRQPRSAKEWATTLATIEGYNKKIKGTKYLKQVPSPLTPVSKVSKVGTELLYNSRVRIYPGLYYENRTPVHSHLLDVHLPRVRLDDPLFSFITEITHSFNEHLALITRLRLILQDRKDYLQNRVDGPGRTGVSFLQDIDYFFAHLSRVEWTFQKLLHTVQQPDFNINHLSTPAQAIFQRLLGKARFHYYRSQLHETTYFGDFTRSKSWFLLYDPYRNLSSKIAGFHAFYSLWASIGSRLAGIHPARNTALYSLRGEDDKVSRHSELAEISMIASPSSFNFLNVIPGSPHTMALGALARCGTAVTSSLSNRVLPRAANTVLRALGYTLDPRQVLWDAADRGVRPNPKNMAPKHHLTQRKAVGDLEHLSETRQTTAKELRSGALESHIGRVITVEKEGAIADPPQTKRGRPKKDQVDKINELEINSFHLGQQPDDEQQKTPRKRGQQKSTRSAGKDQAEVQLRPRYHQPELQSLDEWCAEVQDWAIQKNPFLVPPREVVEEFDLRDDCVMLEIDPDTGETSFYIYWSNKEPFSSTRKVHGVQSLDRAPRFFSPDSVQLNVEDPLFKDLSSIWPTTYGELTQRYRHLHNYRPDVPETPHLQHNVFFRGSQRVHASAAMLLESSTSSNVIRQVEFDKNRLNSLNVPDESLLPSQDSRAASPTNPFGSRRSKDSRPSDGTDAVTDPTGTAKPAMIGTTSTADDSFSPSTPIPMWYRLEFPEVTLQTLATALMNGARDPNQPGVHIHHALCTKNPQNADPKKNNNSYTSPIDQDIDWSALVRRNQFLHLNAMKEAGIPFEHLQANATNINIVEKDSNQLQSIFSDSSQVRRLYARGSSPHSDPASAFHEPSDENDSSFGKSILETLQLPQNSRSQRYFRPRHYARHDGFHLDPDGGMGELTPGEAEPSVAPRRYRSSDLASLPAAFLDLEDTNSLCFTQLDPQSLEEIPEDVSLDDVKDAIGFNRNAKKGSKGPAREVLVQQYTSPETNNTTNPIQPKKKIYRPVCWCCALQVGIGWWNHPPGNSQEYAATRRSLYYYNAPNVDIDSVVSQLPESNPLVVAASHAVGPDYIRPIDRFDEKGFANVNSSHIMSFAQSEAWFDRVPTASDYTSTSDPTFWRQDRSHPNVFMDMQRDLRAVTHTIYRSASNEWGNEPFPANPLQNLANQESQLVGIRNMASRQQAPISPILTATADIDEDTIVSPLEQSKDVDQEMATLLGIVQKQKNAQSSSPDELAHRNQPQRRHVLNSKNPDQFVDDDDLLSLFQQLNVNDQPRSEDSQHNFEEMFNQDEMSNPAAAIHSSFQIEHAFDLFGDGDDDDDLEDDGDGAMGGDAGDDDDFEKPGKAPRSKGFKSVKAMQQYHPSEAVDLERYAAAASAKLASKDAKKAGKKRLSKRKMDSDSE